MPWYLLWDIVWGAFLLGLALSFCIFILAGALIGVLYLLDWVEEQRTYARLKKALLKRPFPKLPHDTGGVHAAIPK